MVVSANRSSKLLYDLEVTSIILFPVSILCSSALVLPFFLPFFVSFSFVFFFALSFSAPSSYSRLHAWLAYLTKSILQFSFHITIPLNNSIPTSMIPLKHQQQVTPEPKPFLSPFGPSGTTHDQAQKALQSQTKLLLLLLLLLLFVLFFSFFFSSSSTVRTLYPFKQNQERNENEHTLDS
jgi:hypothetical protein